MQRPIGVTITAALMVVNLFVDVLLSLLSPSVVVPNTGSHGPAFSSFVILLHVALVAMIVGQCVIVLCYWLGRSWARWFVLLGCVFYLIGLKDLAAQWHKHHSYLTAGLTIGSATLAVYLLWYLHTRDVRDWFARPTIAASATNE
jgi:hypothetical protein